MSASDKQIVDNILREIKNLSIIMKGKTKKDLEDDLTLERAVSMTLTLIGEEASKISNDFREANPAIQWHKITALRNRIVHNYNALDFSIIYTTIKIWIPDLHLNLKQVNYSGKSVKESLLPKKRISQNRGRRL